MGDHTKRKGAMTSGIPKSICFNYDNFKSVVLKHAE